jgi:hypothetical protein
VIVANKQEDKQAADYHGEGKSEREWGRTQLCSRAGDANALTEDDAVVYEEAWQQLRLAGAPALRIMAM